MAVNFKFVVHPRRTVVFPKFKIVLPLTHKPDWKKPLEVYVDKPDLKMATQVEKFRPLDYRCAFYVPLGPCF